MGKTPEDVVITNSLNARQAGGTFFTETVEINGTGFEADNITFENTARNTGQAVAAAVRADKAVFKHCRFLGHQDTLFADYGRQYYVDSYIEGGVDFIFGNATAVFDHSEIHANGPGYLTAQSRTSPEQTTGYAIIDSKVTSGMQPGAESGIAAPVRDTISLGRPWRPYSRVVYINTELPADVIPEGWNAWGKTDSVPQAYYAEFHSTGPGANPAARVAWQTIGMRWQRRRGCRRGGPKAVFTSRTSPCHTGAWTPRQLSSLISGRSIRSSSRGESASRMCFRWSCRARRLSSRFGR
jgi:pectinesterase